MNARPVISSLVAALLLAVLPPLQARARPDDAQAWVTPAIAGYGKVHPRPDAAVQPDPAADYRLFVRVVGARPLEQPDQVMPQLDRLARLVNLMAVARVPPGHVHIVALLDEGALMAATRDDVYRKHTRVASNPNLPLLHALRSAGVKLLVCSQALAGSGLADDAVSPDVTVSLSALTDMAVYGQRGYSYMQL